VVADVVQGVDKFVEDLRWHHDGIAATADIFGDFQKFAAVVCLEIDEENLPVGEDFFGIDRLVTVTAVAAVVFIFVFVNGSGSGRRSTGVLP